MEKTLLGNITEADASQFDSRMSLEDKDDDESVSIKKSQNDEIKNGSDKAILETDKSVARINNRISQASLDRNTRMNTTMMQQIDSPKKETVIFGIKQGVSP
jgi:hypothetical protein